MKKLDVISESGFLEMEKSELLNVNGGVDGTFFAGLGMTATGVYNAYCGYQTGNVAQATYGEVMVAGGLAAMWYQPVQGDGDWPWY